MIRGRITEREKAIMRDLHKQHRSHADIAYILDRDYSGICRCMARLGLLPHGKPGSPSGWKHKAEARQAISAHMQQRWQDPDYRETRVQTLEKARQARRPRPKTIPEMGTADGKYYRKLRDALGFRAAHEIWASQHP